MSKLQRNSTSDVDAAGRKDELSKNSNVARKTPEGTRRILKSKRANAIPKGILTDMTAANPSQAPSTKKNGASLKRYSPDE